MATEIFHVTSVHPVFDSRIFHKQCLSLVENGYNVTLLAAGCVEEDVNGVKIRSVPQERTRFWRILRTPWRIYRSVMKNNADICHIHDPELIPIAILLRLHGKRVVYDVHEDYPRQNLVKFWIPAWFRRPVSVMIGWVEWLGSRYFFTAIIAATPLIAKRFPTHKTIVVQNFPKALELCVGQERMYFDRPENVIYIGVIAATRGVVENVNAMDEVHNSRCRLVLVGTFSNVEDERKCKNLSGWRKVDSKGWMNREQIKQMLANSRAGLVLLHPTANYLDAFPVKLFEYMSAGIPVIASDFPLWREIVETENCGLLVNPLRPTQIAQAIDWLLDHPCEAEQMGENGKKAIARRFNWANESKKLIALYKKLEKQKRTPCR